MYAVILRAKNNSIDKSYSKMGREKWYESFKIEIVKVLNNYEMKEAALLL